MQIDLRNIIEQELIDSLLILEESLPVYNPDPDKGNREGSMARSQLYKASKYAADLTQMFDDQADLPEWVEAKITKASDYLGMVKHYIESEIARDETILEELQEIFGEGFKDKILPYVLAGGAALGGMGIGAGSAQAAPAGELSSVESPIPAHEVSSLETSRKILSLLAKKKINIKKADLAGLDESVAELVSLRRHGKKLSKYTKAAVDIMMVGIDGGMSPADAASATKESFDKRIAREKRKPKTTITKGEFRNNPALIEQGVLGVWFAADQGGDFQKALDKLTQTMVRAIKDGDLTKKQAKKIYKLLDNPGNMEKIQQIIKK